ncbi:hypothetical protein FA95DRAFT_1553238 [Auriscalpium vulgare]|uniref:Uncharacterized protein n=1 Tax=Auriscalpium vulgare TaxID=40419 RepID=A0ACB8S8W2_9AGAM|nr:hypothetical protein FA95DRAFT_1553238 [Auriscalpium vulgare]
MHSLAARLSSASSSRLARLALGAGQTNARSMLSRRIHVRTKLPYNVEDGMGDFLPPVALKMIAEDYQQGLLDRLNDEIRGSTVENQTVAQIVISTATDMNYSLAFNYASLALNNDFFLQHLKVPTGGARDHTSDIGHELQYAITNQQGNLAQVISHVSAAALGMTSTGWVWFVTDGQGNLGVVATYGAGTLLSPDRRQTKDLLGGRYIPKTNPAPPPPAEDEEEFDVPASTSASAPLSGAPTTSPASGLSRQAPPAHPTTQTRAFHMSVPRADDGVAAPASIFIPENRNQGPQELHNGAADSPETDLVSIGAVLYPLFVVSVQEHAWVSAGYGVWGKEEYLKRFWTVLDWGAVSKAYGLVVATQRLSGKPKP